MVNCDVICGADEKWCGVPTEWVSEVRTKIKFKKKMRENLEVF